MTPENCKCRPELLEALKRIAEIAKPGQEVTRSQAVDLLCDAFTTAKEAVAKAEGR